jgi:hypothetical protein
MNIKILPFVWPLCKLRNAVSYSYKGYFMDASYSFLLRTSVILSFGSHVLLFVICFWTPQQYVIKSLQSLVHCELQTVSRDRSAEPHSLIDAHEQRFVSSSGASNTAPILYTTKQVSKLYDIQIRVHEKWYWNCPCPRHGGIVYWRSKLTAPLFSLLPRH